MVSERFSFKGWDWGKFFDSMEKPAVALVSAFVAYIGVKDQPLALLIGAAATMLYAAIKYWLKK